MAFSVIDFRVQKAAREIARDRVDAKVKELTYALHALVTARVERAYRSSSLIWPVDRPAAVAVNRWVCRHMRRDIRRLLSPYACEETIARESDAARDVFYHRLTVMLVPDEDGTS